MPTGLEDVLLNYGEKDSMYRFIHLISAIVRQFFLPNPYSSIIKNAGYADLFNILVGGTIIHILAFILTGCGYSKGIDSPASGSLGYLVSYTYLTFVITGLGYIFSSLMWFVISVVVVYVLSCISVSYIFNRNKMI